MSLFCFCLIVYSSKWQETLLGRNAQTTSAQFVNQPLSLPMKVRICTAKFLLQDLDADNSAEIRAQT
jgi:hypothetical protein